jgi:hypothetical protein
MSKSDFAAMFRQMPEIRKIEIPEAQKIDLVNGHIDVAVSKIVLAHDWDFACATADEPIVANQKDYTLTGAADDCLNVVNIRIGTGDDDEDYQVIEKKFWPEVDGWIKTHGLGVADIWVPQERNNGAPQVRILSTPTDASQTLRYRYWKVGVQYDNLPGQIFDPLLMALLREVFYPEIVVNSPRGMTPADIELGKLIARYQPSGGSVDPMVYDSEVTRRNRERAGKYGYGA